MIILEIMNLKLNDWKEEEIKYVSIFRGIRAHERSGRYQVT